MADLARQGRPIAAERPDEMALYDEVTSYVREQMNRADRLTSMNEPTGFILALVEVSPAGGETVRYLRRPFEGRSEDFVFGSPV